MATKLICDRCEQEIRDRDGKTNLEISPASRENTYYVDLCKDCYRQLQEFLNPKKGTFR